MIRTGIMVRLRETKARVALKSSRITRLCLTRLIATLPLPAAGAHSYPELLIVGTPIIPSLLVLPGVKAECRIVRELVPAQTVEVYLERLQATKNC